MPGRHHTSFAIEYGGDLYWFDAGENCAYTAHQMGLDPLAIRAAFISHPHVDHLAGLPHLFFVIQKIRGREKRQMKYPSVPIFLPKQGIWDGLSAFVSSYGGGAALAGFEPRLIGDGLIIDDGAVRVTALHNRHLREDGSDGWHSFSFRIELAGRAVVFSGDVLSPEELVPLIADGVDLLLLETGHHALDDVCAFVNRNPVGRLLFVHHGREILSDPAGCLARARALACVPVEIGEDATSYPI